MGPCESECPASILDTLTDTDSEYAVNWRARCRATRSEDLVSQLRITIDAIGADGALRITPAAMVRLCATGQALLDDIARCGLSPTGPKAAPSMVTSAPDAT